MRPASSFCAAVGTVPFRTTVLVSPIVSTLMLLASTADAISAAFTSSVSVAASMDAVASPEVRAASLADSRASSCAFVASSSTPRDVFSHATLPNARKAAAVNANKPCFTGFTINPPWPADEPLAILAGMQFKVCAMKKTARVVALTAQSGSIFAKKGIRRSHPMRKRRDLCRLSWWTET
jgi:hypothetical protein